MLEREGKGESGEEASVSPVGVVWATKGQHKEEKSVQGLWGRQICNPLHPKLKKKKKNLCF